MDDIYLFDKNEEIKQFIRNFQSIRYYNLKIIGINLKLEEIESEYGVHSIDISKEPCSVVFGNYRLNELIEEETRLIDKKNEYIRLINDVDVIFKQIPEDIQKIMIDLYLLRHNHYKVAKKYSYTRQSIYRIVNNSIKKALNL